LSLETRTPREIPLDDLLPAEWNANRVPPKTLEKLRNSFQTFGVVENLVARPHPDEPGKFEVVSGNHRLGLLREFGVDVAPVVVVELEDAEARILAQTLNRTRGQDDPEAYARLLEQVLARTDIAQVTSLLPETSASIDRVLASFRPAASDPGPGLPPVVPDSEPGKVYQLGEHRLMCGDARDSEQVSELCGKQPLPAMVTDPPYGIEHDGIANDDPHELRSLYDAVLKAAPLRDAVVASFQSPRLVIVWLDAIRAAGHNFERLLWLHRQAAKTYPWRSWVLASDAIALSSIGQPEWPPPGDFSHDTYVKTELEDEFLTGLHSTIKPAWVVRDLLLKLPAGPVYEPFAGSGTTLVAAEQLGRSCLAMEIDPGYCDVIRERYERMAVATAA